ncbi:MAG: 1-acyl-sn-glycerol-3-phosphate acyltransferase [Planctomycetaceae bacterium]|nr:1-acyl-sn-glycerol-3-phosphate acyltransferase [Planctomycetaceae bacterium]
MHNVVIEEPYEFIPPHRGRLLSWAFRYYLPTLLRKKYGVAEWTIDGLEHLREAIAAGHGIILCPNHCRLSDPMLMGLLCRETPCHVYTMASWHVFKQNPTESFIVRRLGGFSVYREGMDRQALDTSIEIVTSAERPLIIFPEGAVSRGNDRLLPFMDGVSFIARMAAKKRARIRDDARVVVLPVAVRYRLLRSVDEAVHPVLERLEQRTFWKTQQHRTLRERISLLAQALLAAREIECLGQPQSGRLTDRVQQLIDIVLQPQEREWLGAARTGDVVTRVKDLRTAILSRLLKKDVDQAERDRWWRQLTDAYYVQCLSLYPSDYLVHGANGKVTDERIVETVHRLEEDMTDSTTIHPEWRAEFRIGQPMTIDPDQKRSRDGDTLMNDLRQRMLDLLGVQDWWPPQGVRKADPEEI